MNNLKIFSNDPNSIIRLGNNQDSCYICKHELIESFKEKTLSRDEQWRMVFELEGKHEYEPMLKIRHNGNDICICEDHIHDISKIISKISKQLKDEKSEKSENKKEK